MLSDEIREFVFRNYIEPARTNGKDTVTIRAGDVHKQMGLKDRMPAISSALGANKFQDQYNVQLLTREGPHMGSNMFLTFKV